MKCMAVKDDTVHLIDEASYNVNIKEETWPANPGFEGQLGTDPSTLQQRHVV